MSTIFIRNAAIATMDQAAPHAETAVIEGKYFAFIGSEAAAREYIARHPGEDVRELDCHGEFLMPGFNDSHMHYLHYVKAKYFSLDLSGTTSLREVMERMERGLKTFDIESGLWLLGEGWNQDYFTDEKRFPTADDLDGISADIPIMITRACFHIGVLNSKAMELIGLDAASAARYGEYVETDPCGRPNGVIKESLFDDVKAALPAPSPEELVDMMLDTQQDLFRYGVTSVQSDDLKYMPEGKAYDMLPLLRKAGEDGRLKLRIAEQALLPTKSELDEFLYTNGLDASYGNDTFKISCLKLLADGSLGARTALMRKPYFDAPETCGIAIYDQPSLDALVLEAHRNNLPAIIHAIGDGAVEMCLNSIECARREYPHLHPRHGIVHCQITDKAQLRRFRELDVFAYIQPIFIDYDMHIVYDRVGEALASTSYAWRTYIESGVHTGFGTDCPVESFRPLPGIYCATTRRDLKGSAPFLADQKLTREQALFAYTAAGAYASRDEKVKGMIKEGMLADFITLDTDLISCTDDELLQANVTRTYVGGVKVFEK